MQRALIVILLLIAAINVPSVALGADNRACKLLTAAEVESVLGGKLSAFQGQSYTTGDMCTASSATVSVILRLGKKEQADASAKILDMMRKMGGTVEVKTTGPITCSTISPPEHMQHYGFKTACSLTKAVDVAVVEVRVKDQKNMVSIDKLRPLADKMAGRF
jgi:hypothetical protein